MMFNTFSTLLLIGVLCRARGQDSTDQMDAPSICKNLNSAADSAGDTVTGSVVGCKMICNVTSSKTGKTVSKAPVNVEDYISCGSDMVCYLGDCKTNQTDAAKACAAKYPKSYGTGANCKATCKFNEDKTKKTKAGVPYINGTACLNGGVKVGQCMGGVCVPGTNVSDPTEACKSLKESDVEKGKEVAGDAQGCLLRCNVTTTNAKGVNTTVPSIVKMPNYSDCGENHTCYNGGCVKNDNKATEACQAVSSNYGVVVPPCKSTCHFVEGTNDDKTKLVNLPNGTDCVLAGQLAKCQGGACKLSRRR